MISKTYLSDGTLIHDQAVVRALNSITSQQVDAVAEITRASGQDWNVHAVDDYDGYRSILLETARQDDEQKSFFVAGTAHRLELFETKDDSLALLGTFNTMRDLETRLTGLVSLRQRQDRI